MSNYKIVSTKNKPRVELKDALNLSGCELSINELPANASVNFKLRGATYGAKCASALTAADVRSNKSNLKEKQ